MAATIRFTLPDGRAGDLPDGCAHCRRARTAGSTLRRERPLARPARARRLGAGRAASTCPTSTSAGRRSRTSTSSSRKSARDDGRGTWTGRACPAPVPLRPARLPAATGSRASSRSCCRCSSSSSSSAFSATTPSRSAGGREGRRRYYVPGISRSASSRPRSSTSSSRSPRSARAASSSAAARPRCRPGFSSRGGP